MNSGGNSPIRWSARESDPPSPNHIHDFFHHAAKVQISDRAGHESETVQKRNAIGDQIRHGLRELGIKPPSQNRTEQRKPELGAMPPSPARRRADKLKKTKDCRDDAPDDGPPVMREKVTCLHENSRQQRQVPSGLLEQGR